MARRRRREGVSGRRGAGGGRSSEVRAGAGREHRRDAEKSRGQSTEEKEGMRRREEGFTGKKVSREGSKRLREAERLTLG